MMIGRVSNRLTRIDIDSGYAQVGGDRVSRRHAEIIKRGQDYFIRDLGSLNGTYISVRDGWAATNSTNCATATGGARRRHIGVPKRLTA